MSQANLRRLRFAPCGADLFVDPGSGYVYPAFEALEVGGAVKMYPRAFQASDHDHFAQAAGEREAEIKFTMEGRGFGGATPGAGSAVVAGDGENGLLLKSIFGTQVKDTGSTCATGTTTTAITVASTTNLSVGSFVGAVDPTTSLLHVRQVRSKTGTVLTLDRALPFTPANGAALYASATYSHAISGHQHLFFDAEGYDATPAKGWRRALFGCLGDFSMKNLGANGKLALEFSFRALDWDDPAQGTNQTAPTYPANLPASGAFIRQTRLHVGASQLVVAEFGYELGNEIQGKPSTAAKNGNASWLVTDAKQTMSFKVAVEDAHAASIYIDSVGSSLDVLVELTQGGPGNSFALAAPVAQIVEVKPATMNGLDFYDVALAIQRNALTGVPAAAFGVL
jgi:hypothetical protein